MSILRPARPASDDADTSDVVYEPETCPGCQATYLGAKPPRGPVYMAWVETHAPHGYQWGRA